MAEQVLQRWLQTIGGAERVEAVKSTYQRSRIEMGGLSGTLEEWQGPHGERRSDMDLSGLIKSTTVLNNAGQGWIQDQNGQVRELGGIELEIEITSAYQSSFSYLLPGRMPGRVEKVGEDERYIVLKSWPKNGQPVTFFLDKTTGWPEKEEHPAADRTRTVYLSDWRSVEGVLFPFHFRQTTGDPRYDVVVQVEEIRLNPPLEPTLFQRPAEAAPDYRFSSGSSTPPIPFELNSNHIYVQAQINGAGPLWFIFDTGAGATCVAMAQAQALGLEMHGKLEARGAGESSTDAGFITGASFQLPGVEVVGQTIASIAMGSLEPYEGRPIHGILGYDLISRFVAEIDYATREIRLFEAAEYQYHGPGEILPVILDGNVPYIHARLLLPGREPLEGKFLVDTGARVGVDLTRPFVEAHRLMEAVPKTIAAPYGAGVGGETKQRLGRLAGLQLNRQVLPDVVACFSEDVRGAGADPDSAGLIGGEVLRRFKVILDYSRQRIILEPGAQLTEPHEYDMSGLFLVSEGPAFLNFQVKRVVDPSPAAEAGLQVGDTLVALDGQPAAGFTLEQVRQLFKQDGRVVQLEVRRGQEKLLTTLKLRRLV